MNKLKINAGWNLFGAFFVLLFLDFLIFRWGIWKLPNESPWGTNHFFNFIYEMKRISGEKSDRPLILIVGSSIAYYSLDRDALSTYVKEKTGKDFRVEYFSYAGMTPLDAHLLAEQILQLKPAMVLYPLNFIDYRLHRAYSMNPQNSNLGMSEAVMIRDALNFIEAPQSKFAFPSETLHAFWKILSLEENSSYAISMAFGFYKYREIYLANLKNLYNHRFGRNTSYHGYGGVQIPERVTSLGWTGRKFSFRPVPSQKRGIWIQVVPELLKNGPLKIEITNRVGKRQSEVIANHGWYHLKLMESFFQSDSLITATLSQTWKPWEAQGDRFDYSLDELGVRLPQTFGLERPISGMHYIREERLEDLRFLGMDNASYRESFQFRLLKDPHKRPGIAYLLALKVAKERIAAEKFHKTIHFKYLESFRNSMNNANVPLLLINNPENPISMEWYASSVWYKDYLQFLEHLQEGTVSVFDFKDKLDMQDFTDFHHFTYPAMQKMNFRYGDAIISKIPN